MRPISPRERRLVALLILVALIAAVHFLVVAPIAAGFAARAEARDRLALTYAHNVRTIATIPQVRRVAEARRAAARSFVVDAPDAEAGREWLKLRLQRAITGAGGAFREGADAEAPPGWARARAAARMTWPQVIAALAALQNQPPWVIVDAVRVTAGNTIVPGQSPTMDVELEASVPIRPAAAR